MGAIQQSLKRARALRPSTIRQQAHRPFRLELLAADGDDHQALCRVFIPDGLAGPARAQALAHLASSAAPDPAALRVRSPRVAAPALATLVAVDGRDPEPGLLALLRACPEHRLALARVFPPFRPLLARELIHAVAARNAAIAAVSALPDVIPTPLSLALALGEMGSDTVLLTANQIGLCFQLAALRDHDVGWRAQLGPIAGILAGSLGWRTLARELVGLIPAGVGLAAKSAIAYSGTVAVGRTLCRVAADSTTSPGPLRPRPFRRQLASRP
ncbi:MAG TPA: hypothetical protein VMV31_05240 [Terriglobales bacterium]|nr:hypothetical protein [Terriglobales bacterium]